MTEHLRQTLQPQLRQVMGFALHQSQQILQMTQIELAEWIQEELERNPILEPIDRPREKKSMTIDQFVPAKPNFRDHLMRQVGESRLDDSDRRIAYLLIDQLDERGWFSTPVEEIQENRESVLRILLVLQTFDPPGVFARNLQECLWLQLRSKSYSLAEVIIRDHFSDLLQGRFQAIQKRLRVPIADLQKALHDIARLKFRPAEPFHESIVQNIVPDLTLNLLEHGYQLVVGEEELPLFAIREDYATLELTQKEEKQQLRSWTTGAKWLQRCIERRRKILQTIGRLLVTRESAFFKEMGELVPIEIQELAQLLNVHETTAWRAIASKTLACPRGLMPLKQFFSESATKEPVKDLMRRLIQHENKSIPLTDDAIMKKLGDQGLRCARRTITKYRRALHISSAAHRKILN